MRWTQPEKNRSVYVYFCERDSFKKMHDRHKRILFIHMNCAVTLRLDRNPLAKLLFIWNLDFFPFHRLWKIVDFVVGRCSCQKKNRRKRSEENDAATPSHRPSHAHSDRLFQFSLLLLFCSMHFSNFQLSPPICVQPFFSIWNLFGFASRGIFGARNVLPIWPAAATTTSWQQKIK